MIRLPFLLSIYHSKAMFIVVHSTLPAGCSHCDGGLIREAPSLTFAVRSYRAQTRGTVEIAVSC